MARVTKTSELHKHFFELSMVNYRYLVDEVLGHRSFGTALNSELEFVRSFEIPPTFLLRLQYEAARRHATLREFVQESVYELALGLPIPKKVAPEKKAPRGIKRSGSLFTMANHRHLQRLVVERKSGFSEVLNSELDFARTYGLTPGLLMRLRHHAAQKGQSAKDVLRDMLSTRGVEVVDPPASWQPAA